MKNSLRAIRNRDKLRDINKEVQWLLNNCRMHDEPKENEVRRIYDKLKEALVFFPGMDFFDHDANAFYERLQDSHKDMKNLTKIEDVANYLNQKMAYYNSLENFDFLDKAVRIEWSQIIFGAIFAGGVNLIIGTISSSVEPNSMLQLATGLSIILISLLWIGRS